jgi:hypothetical protein
MVCPHKCVWCGMSEVLWEGGEVYSRVYESERKCNSYVGCVTVVSGRDEGFLLNLS